MRRFTLCDFQYVHLKLRHYRYYHDVEQKAIEIYKSVLMKSCGIELRVGWVELLRPIINPPHPIFFPNLMQ